MLVTSQLKSMMEFMIVKPVQRWLARLLAPLKKRCVQLGAFRSVCSVFTLFRVKSQVHTRSRVKYTHGE